MTNDTSGVKDRGHHCFFLTFPLFWTAPHLLPLRSVPSLIPFIPLQLAILSLPFTFLSFLPFLPSIPLISHLLLLLVPAWWLYLLDKMGVRHKMFSNLFVSAAVEQQEDKVKEGRQGSKNNDGDLNRQKGWLTQFVFTPWLIWSWLSKTQC